MEQSVLVEFKEWLHDLVNSISAVIVENNSKPKE